VQVICLHGNAKAGLAHAKTGFSLRSADGAGAAATG